MLAATFSWQDDAGIRLARALNGSANFEIAPEPVVPLDSTRVVASDLVVDGSDNFVLVVDATEAGQQVVFADGGVHALEVGTPLIITGTWSATGPPTIFRLRALRLGHRVVNPRLAHSVSDDSVYLAGLCQGSTLGPWVAPCSGAGAGFFVVRVQPL